MYPLSGNCHQKIWPVIGFSHSKIQIHISMSSKSNHYCNIILVLLPRSVGFVETLWSLINEAWEWVYFAIDEIMFSHLSLETIFYLYFYARFGRIAVYNTLWIMCDAYWHPVMKWFSYKSKCALGNLIFFFCQTNITKWEIGELALINSQLVNNYKKSVSYMLGPYSIAHIYSFSKLKMILKISNLTLSRLICGACQF